MGKILFLNPKQLHSLKQVRHISEQNVSKPREGRRDQDCQSSSTSNSPKGSLLDEEVTGGQTVMEDFPFLNCEEGRVKEHAQNLILEAAFLLQNFAEDNDKAESRVAWLLEDCAQILMERRQLELVCDKVSTSNASANNNFANQNFANQSESEL